MPSQVEVRQSGYGVDRQGTARTGELMLGMAVEARLGKAVKVWCGDVWCGLAGLGRRGELCFGKTR